MAEQVTIFDLDINVDAAIQDSAELTKSIDGLKNEIKELQKAEGDNSVAIAEKTAQLKAEQTELRTNQKLTQNVIAAQKANAGSIDQLRKQLSVVSVQWARLSKEERENTEEGKELTRQKLELTEALKAEERATGDARRNVGNYSEGIGDAITQTAGLDTQLLSLAANPIGAVIAAIGLIVTTLTKAVQRNEKASENLNKVFAVFKGTLDGLLNALGPLVEFLTEKLLDAFENPKQSIIDLGDAIKDNIINRVKAVLVFGDAFTALFERDFKKAAKLGADAFIQLGTGIKDGTDKIAGAIEATKEFAISVVEETNKAIDANKRLANSERELLRIQKQFELQQLTFQKLAEDQRQIRDDEAESIEARIEANKQLGALLDDQLAKELELAQQQLQFAQLRAQAEGETLETEEAVFDARIKIAEINERIDSQRSEQLTNQNSLLKEQQELELEIIEQEVAAFEAQVQAEIERTNKIAEIRQEARDRENEARLVDAENQFALAQGNIFRTLELEREGLEIQKQQELDFAESVGADTTAIEEKYAKAREEINKAEVSAKLSLASDFASNVAQIAGEGTAVGKAAAVAATTIQTYQAAQGAFAALAPIPIVGPALGAAAAAAAVVSGLGNVKKILSVKSGLPGEKSVSASGAGGASTPNISAPRASAGAPGVNEGIVSRDIQGINTDNGLIVQPTLVTDDVTVSQDQELANNQTAAI